MRLMRRVLVVYLLAAVLLGFRVLSMGEQPAGGTSAPASPGGNAAWIDQHWVQSPPSPSSIAPLCTQLKNHQIGTIFVHVGPADASGSIAEGRAPYAGRFVTEFHLLCPQVRVLAWIGQLLPSWDGLVNLQNSSTRGGLARTAARFVALGYDGIQYDLEPVANGDPAFLSLLRLTRSAIGGHWLAVAGPAITPAEGMPRLPRLRLPLLPWSSSYYARVGALVDELDPMLYITGLGNDADYAKFVSVQARAFTRTLPSATIRLGLPAFSGRNQFFDDRAENVPTALLGITRAYGNGAIPKALTGIAIYPMWDMTPTGWVALDNWLALSHRRNS
ncbi:MAG: hypothetical protein JWO42_1156 [Chloroflexi bacterium]|nr:hypothetical protein [Chloroflexota bacterium]